ncbi:hypothetical protein NT2_10_00600 [Caenibius tardaugens NBRC 16725]|uniref:Uncharacterized protein n=1 Tax=Caenibius tardaugens NBRC 16725 TaxID=1219035 RepID=U2YNZ3_9SPHN|nr:hypothetical protein NT2_10_00600 [Caenibius tardaugens NBRC 16725]
MIRRLLPIFAFMLMEGLALAEGKDWTPELEAIADKCGLPHDSLKWIDGSVRWFKPESATYGQSMCVIGELRAKGIPIKQGFVSDGS